ncbi:MAG: succinyl-diaminopimelate desuccinylase [Xanthomonadales bacterium]|nr:succinyl-diaminopimelate desuccinylase [Xanthomonadales bacterium]
MSMVLDLTRDLIRRPSITPADEGCQVLIADYLAAFGFTCEWFNRGDVSNVLLSHGTPENGPSILMLGHTDVVPVGDENSWKYPPFAARVDEGILYGRGSADMKGGVAAMVIALQRLVEEFPDHPGCVQLLLTSDEEGPATDGTCVVADALKQQDRIPDYCLVGEPTSSKRLGDMARVGRRGSINVRLIIEGEQGHTAFGHLIENPAHKLAAFLAVVTNLRWDEGDALFPATSLQVSALQAGGIATNVTPAIAETRFNLRNGPVSPQSDLKQRMESILADLNINNYQLDWNVSAEPFYTPAGALTAVVEAAVAGLLGYSPAMNTGGGTSDGRFIAPLGTQVVELGLLNHSIHKIDEHTPVADLDLLMAVYFDILRRLLKL